MPWLTLALIGVVVLLLAGDLALWTLFARRARTVHFPVAGTDAGALFFRMHRLRFLTVLHALALGTWLFFSIVWLW